MTLLSPRLLPPPTPRPDSGGGGREGSIICAITPVPITPLPYFSKRRRNDVGGKVLKQEKDSTQKSIGMDWGGGGLGRLKVRVKYLSKRRKPCLEQEEGKETLV